MRIEEIIGAHVAELRAARNMTQTELGQRVAHYIGQQWSRQAVSAAEHGGRAFVAAELLALAAILDTTIGAFFIPTDSTDVPEIETPGGKAIPLNTVLRHALDAAGPTANAADVRAQLRVADEREQLAADKLRLRAMLAEYAEEAMQVMRGQKDMCLAEIRYARSKPADDGDFSHSLTIEEFAERQRVKPGTVREWLRIGDAPRHYTMRRLVRFRLADVETWEKERMHDAEDPGTPDAYSDWGLDIDSAINEGV